MKRVLTLAIGLVLLLACVGTVAAGTDINLLSNAGFEKPVVQDPRSWDWYNDGTSGLDWHVERGIGAQADIEPVVEIQTESAIGHIPYEGKQFIELDSHANVNILQSFQTENGATYRISYAQSCRENDPYLPSTIGVFVNDKEILTTSEGMKTTNGCKDWQVHTVDFTGDGREVTLKFAGEGISDQYGPLLDGAEVTDPVIPSPEFPSAFLPATFIIGFIGVIFLIQRTRN